MSNNACTVKEIQEDFLSNSILALIPYIPVSSEVIFTIRQHVLIILSQCTYLLMQNKVQINSKDSVIVADI